MNWRSRISMLLQLFGISVALNAPWEIGQAFLYVGMDYSRAMYWHCFVASLGDGVLVLLIYLVGWLVLRRADWFRRPGWQGLAVMLLTGLTIGMLVEWLAVHMLGRWIYTNQMPIIPGLDLGVVPVIQMMVLPLAAFYIVSRRIWPGQTGLEGKSSTANNWVQ